MSGVCLIKPNTEHLQSYIQALRRASYDWQTQGATPEDKRRQSADIASKRILSICADPQQFLSLFDDLRAQAAPYMLADKTVAYAVPSLRRWIWDTHSQAYCGTISLRWQYASTALPAHLMGHIGYSVVPWMQNKGYASFALAQILKLAKITGLKELTLVTDADNLPSQRVILKNGGRLAEKFYKPAVYGGTLALRYVVQIEP